MQTLNQKRALKVAIGRDYWPAPTRRTMPRHWTLHTNDKPKSWLPSSGACVAATIVMAWIFAIAVTANWIKL